MRKEWLAAGISCLLLSAGCTDGEPGPLDASPSPSPQVSSDAQPPSDCPTEIAAAQNETHPAESSFLGDVDGDGELDPISIESFPTAESGCQAILTVFVDDAPSSISLEQEGVDFASGAPPSLLGVADVDGRPGDEIIVRLVSGASTEFTGLYTAASGSLERLTVSGGEFGDLFPSGGSVGHLEQSDCAEPGTVVIATAVPKGAKYQVTRTRFRFDGEAFSPDDEKTVLVDAEELASGAVPEFSSGAPFGSCPTD